MLLESDDVRGGADDVILVKVSVWLGDALASVASVDSLPAAAMREFKQTEITSLLPHGCRRCQRSA